MEKIIEIVEEIVGDKNIVDEKKKIKHYKKKYSEEFDKFPKILENSCEKDFDVDKLKWMIEMQKKIYSKELSSHNANIEVGERLVNEYIKPKLNEEN